MNSRAAEVTCRPYFRRSPGALSVGQTATGRRGDADLRTLDVVPQFGWPRHRGPVDMRPLDLGPLHLGPLYLGPLLNGTRTVRTAIGARPHVLRRPRVPLLRRDTGRASADRAGRTIGQRDLRGPAIRQRAARNRLLAGAGAVGDDTAAIGGTEAGRAGVLRSRTKSLHRAGTGAEARPNDRRAEGRTSPAAQNGA